VNWTTKVGIRSVGGGSWVCEGFDSELVVPDPGMGLQRCPIRAVTQISKEQYLATPHH
jgi:hypothetical protein